MTENKINKILRIYHSLSESEKESLPIEYLNETESAEVRDYLKDHFNNSGNVDPDFALFLITKFRSKPIESIDQEKPKHLKHYHQDKENSRDFLTEFNSISKEDIEDYPVELMNNNDHGVWLELVNGHLEGRQKLQKPFFDFLVKKFKTHIR